MRKGLVALACVAAAAAGLSHAQAPANSHHALVIAIGAYGDSAISPLPGIERDVENAIAMAQFLGVPRARTTVLRDKAAVAGAARSELARIAAAVQRNEKVFIYFSGHGSRWRPSSGSQCVESLVFHDNEHITKDELAGLLKPIAERADKLVLFLDSCHSGGVIATRAGRRSGFVPKFHETGNKDECQVAINDLAERISPVPLKTRGAQPSNVVLVAAARQNEYALHREDIGGLATHAWSRCAMGRARDEDGSGAVSFAEVEACAQREIESELKGVQDYAAHHVTTLGTRGLPLALFSAISTIYSTVKTVNEVTQAVSAAKKDLQGAKGAAVLGPVVGLLGTLNDIASVSDARWELQVEPERTQLRIGRDFLSFRVRSPQAGFVYVLAVGSDNKTVDLLFPNKVDSDNVIRAGAEMTLPRPAWRLQAAGPEGTNHVLVMVSETERDFRNVSLQDLAGIFKTAGAESAPALQGALYQAQPEQQGCRAVNTRNLVVQSTGCAGRYAAQLMKIEEVQ